MALSKSSKDVSAFSVQPRHNTAIAAVSAFLPHYLLEGTLDVTASSLP
jgi:hypothetical protein